MLTRYPRFTALTPDLDNETLLRAALAHVPPAGPFAVALLPPDCAAVRVARGRCSAASSYRDALGGHGLTLGVPSVGLTLVPTGAAAPSLYDGHGRADDPARAGGVTIAEPVNLGGAA